MRPATLIATLALAAALPGVATAAPSACPEHYPGGLAPDILRPTLAERARELCFRSYAVLHSGVSRTALAAAEHLTRERVQAARGLERENAFHEEERLPPEERAQLADYARSGFDRGHVAPSGDMPTPEAQAESFSLANMVPQDPGSNRCLWEGIESAVRDLATREGEVFVLTGPIFRGQTLRQLNGRVLVPTDLFKAVYVPSRGEAAAYVAPNAPGLDWRAVPLSELRELAGLDVYPSPAAGGEEACAAPARAAAAQCGRRLRAHGRHRAGGSVPPTAVSSARAVRRWTGRGELDDGDAGRCCARGRGAGGTAVPCARSALRPRGEGDRNHELPAVRGWGGRAADRWADRGEPPGSGVALGRPRIAALEGEGEALPERVAPAEPPSTVKNPFG